MIDSLIVRVIENVLIMKIKTYRGHEEDLRAALLGGNRITSLDAARDGGITFKNNSSEIRNLDDLNLHIF